MNKIKSKILELVLKHKTNDPFKICKLENIFVHELDLHHEINGIFHKEGDFYFIYINKNLPENEKKLTCAHELAHFILHRELLDSKSILCTSSTKNNIHKYEEEANKFSYILTHRFSTPKEIGSIFFNYMTLIV